MVVKHTLQKNTRESFWSLLSKTGFFMVYRMELSSLDNLLLEMALGLISGLLELFIVRMIGLLKTPVCCGDVMCSPFSC